MSGDLLRALFLRNDGFAPGALAKERINFGAGKLASRNLLLKERVELSITAALGFWESEVAPGEAQEAGSSPEEAGLGSPVPCGWVELAWGEDVGDDAANVVEVTCQHHGLLSESGGRDFGDERIADGSDGAVVDKCEEEKHASDSPLRSDVLG